MKKYDMAGLIAGLAGIFIVVYAVNLFNGYVLGGLPVLLRMPLMVVSYWSIALFPCLISRYLKDRASDLGFKGNEVWRQLFTGILTGAGMSVIFTLVPHLAGFGEYVDNERRYIYLWQFIFEFVYCIGAVSLVEEFCFRGFIFARIKKLTGRDGFAIAGSSVLFGLFHMFSGDPLQLVITSALGVFFCLCRSKLKYCSTLSLIIAHGIYDAMISVWSSVFFS